MRSFVLFVIDLKTYRVEIAGIVSRADGDWMKQVARNLTDCAARCLDRTVHLIHARDPLFTEGVWAILEHPGVMTVTPATRSPDWNAFAERFVRSVSSECLVQIIPLGERHLRKAVRAYPDHYHSGSHHRGLDDELIEERRDEPDMHRAVACREGLGGILNDYQRRAA